MLCPLSPRCETAESVTLKYAALNHKHFSQVLSLQYRTNRAAAAEASAGVAIDRFLTDSDTLESASADFGAEANLALAAAFCMNFRCDSLAVALTRGLVPGVAPAGEDTGGDPDIGICIVLISLSDVAVVWTVRAVGDAAAAGGRDDAPPDAPVATGRVQSVLSLPLNFVSKIHSKAMLA